MFKKVKRVQLSMILWIMAALLLTGCAAGTLLPQVVAEGTGDSTTLSELEGQEATIPELADPIGYSSELPEAEAMQVMITQYNMNYTLKSAEGARMVMKGGEIEENEIEAVSGFITADGTESTTTYEVAVSPSYTLAYEKPQEACGVAFGWSEDLFAFVNGSGIETVEGSISGVRLTGEAMEYEIRYYLGNEDHVILIVKGTGDGAVCLMRTEDGFRFYCANGATLTLQQNAELKAVQTLEVPAGQIGVVERFSEGCNAVLRTEPDR